MHEEVRTSLILRLGLENSLPLPPTTYPSCNDRFPIGTFFHLSYLSLLCLSANFACPVAVFAEKQSPMSSSARRARAPR